MSSILTSNSPLILWDGHLSTHPVWSKFSSTTPSCFQKVNARQWNGNKQSENPPGVKTWRTYHNTVSTPRASLLHSFHVVRCPSPFLSLPHTLILPLPLSQTCGCSYICCVCDRKLCLLSSFHPTENHYPTHQPLLTSDLHSPTCPLFTPLVLLALSTSDVKRLSVQLINRYNSLMAEGQNL